ncbi:MAG: Stk1 family PASTA domain-containing Ser/Thr kinase [Actinomycetota bacterium]|nr:Stk1 family PASTA domain-containing Ser/Thr kinase [Actinomycetota bacterium]
MSTTSEHGGAPTPGTQVVLAGRYQLDRLIGRGGMAEVWAARDQVLEREVAVKLLSSRFSDDEQFQQRFRREAQQAASLNHPNVVAVYDTGDHEGLPFIVMELVRGRSLQQIQETGGLTEERALEICAEACSALGYAHQRGLVHRDVKPGNILVASDGTVKVTDFGIARAVTSQTVTQTAAVLGTAAYLSPEQAQGAPVDTRSDVYSLGIVLYELLAKRQPFQGDTAVGVAYQHVQENPVPPRQFDASISPAAEAITIKALAKNPSNRYPTALAMRDDLLRARAGESVSAPAVLLPDEAAALDTELLKRSRPPATAVQERRRRTMGYLLLAVMTVVAFAGLVWLLASLLGGDAKLRRTVPNIEQQTFEEAKQILEAHGLRASYAADEHSDVVPKGRVLRQDPGAGEQVDDGDVVALTISLGPMSVSVPDVRGRSVEDAIAALRDAGLPVADQKTQFSDELAKGRVIATDPPAGESVVRGTPITLLVSAGEEREIVPNVTGQLESEARFRLEERGFRVLLTREFSDTVARGRVIRQEPEGSTRAPKGSEVTIVVSEGAPTPPPSAAPSPQPAPTLSPTVAPSEDPDERSRRPAPGITIGRR